MGKLMLIFLSLIFNLLLKSDARMDYLDGSSMEGAFDCQPRNRMSTWITSHGFAYYRLRNLEVGQSFRLHARACDAAGEITEITVLDSAGNVTRTCRESVCDFLSTGRVAYIRIEGTPDLRIELMAEDVPSLSVANAPRYVSYTNMLVPSDPR